MAVRSARFPEDREAVDRLLDTVERYDGYVPLTEEAELDYRDGPRCPGLVAVDGSRLTGYAHLSEVGGTTTVEVAIHPECRTTQGRRLLAAAIGAAGPGPLALWASDDDLVASAAALGLEERRAVLQFVGPLPPVSRAVWPEGVSAGPSAPGRDVPELVELNRAAFAGHPDNASWDAAVIRDRMARHWFDPGGLIAARRDGHLVGACWTKTHRGGIGEIYWLAVHPAEQGRSIGRALVLAGLWHLAAGCGTATVYTEADNLRARRLYERLGFRLLRTKRRLER